MGVTSGVNIHWDSIEPILWPLQKQILFGVSYLKQPQAFWLFSELMEYLFLVLDIEFRYFHYLLLLFT